VWQEIIRVLEEPELIQAEIQRRLEAAQKSDPVRKREQSLRRELTRLEASMERLLTAYQENLLTLARTAQTYAGVAQATTGDTI
jgi:site-specific DNA recombinase